MIALRDWGTVCERLTSLGFLPGDIEWAEAITAPNNAREFAEELIFVICNSGMKNTVAEGIYRRVRAALADGKSACTAFGHVGKATAIDTIWKTQQTLFVHYEATADKLAYLRGLPWIGPITCFHAAKNFGLDVVKPDVHLARLAAHHETTPTALCENLAVKTGLRLATVDTVLWRACAEGVINSRTGAIVGHS